MLISVANTTVLGSPATLLFKLSAKVTVALSKVLTNIALLLVSSLAATKFARSTLAN